MRAIVWFRVAAVLMLLFAVGHTFGFLAFRPPTAEGLAVWEAMQRVQFSVRHSTFSYGGFYVGFGLFISAFGLFGAWLAWVLGSMARRGVMEARTIAWGMFGLQCVSLGLALKYFSVGPAMLSGLTAVCFLVGAVRVQQPETASAMRS